MRSGWLVMTETQWIGMIPSLRPAREWRFYRFRWVARWIVWVTNHVPPGPLPTFSTAQLLGRARMKRKHLVRSGSGYA